MKECKECGEKKNLDCFYREKTMPDGYRKICKTCKNKKIELWRHTNRKRYNANMRSYNKKHYGRLRLLRYKLKEEQYQAMLVDQKNLCAICSKPPTGRYPLAIDHDHDTGIVRGLLCHACNRVMVLVDNPERLKLAMAYRQRALPKQEEP